jgi:hypothetical protein
MRLSAHSERWNGCVPLQVTLFLMFSCSSVHTFSDTFCSENSLWNGAFQLGAYEALNYFSHLQKFLGMIKPNHSSPRTMFSRVAVNPSVQARENTHVVSGRAHFQEVAGAAPTQIPCLLHIVAERILPAEPILDPPAPYEISEASRIWESPQFRTAFAARRRKLELRTDLTDDELIELALLYRFQSHLDAHDMTRGTSTPDSSSSPDISVSEASSIAICMRMDRSLVLGFSRVVDSAQLNIPDGKHSLWSIAKSADDHADASVVQALSPLRKLQCSSLPPFTHDQKQYTKFDNISNAALKCRPNAPSPHPAFPTLMQRLSEASCLSPLHGVLPHEFLNCYEVSLLHVNVHSKITATTSQRSQSQTLLSDPNTATKDTTTETFRQHDFSDSMLCMMQEHRSCSALVSAFRHSFAAHRSNRIVISHALVFILVMAFALSAASGPEVSGFVQYIRKLVSVSSIPSLTSMAEFQANVRLLAPLLWLHCDSNPSSCGLSRVGSLRITQWRRSSLADAPCFSNSEFVQSCLNVESKSVSKPPALLHANTTSLQGRAAIGNNGEIVVLLDSSPADEELWNALFKPGSSFFTAETSRMELVATMFSPKLQHFVSFQIVSMLDGGYSQSRSVARRFLLQSQRHLSAGVCFC